jgi:hypothetical protein
MIPSTARMCINCGWERNPSGAWPPKPGGPPRRPPPPIFITPPARTPLANFGLLLAGIVVGLALLAGGTYLLGLLNYGWTVYLGPAVLAAFTARRYGMFSLGLALSYPLALLGAFAACVIGLSHYNR